MLHKKQFLLLALLSLTACQVGPKYTPPAVEVPESFKNETAPDISYEDVGVWWQVFDDPTLNKLEEAAVANNQNIMSAIASVKLEWALAGVNEADLFPQVHFNPSFTNTASLINSFLNNQTIPGLNLPSTLRYNQKQYLIPVSVRYMADFWLKNWDNFMSAVNTAEAQEEALMMTILTITTDVATNYFQLRSYEQQLRILDDAIVVREEALKINSDRFKAGLSGELDVSQAQAELSAAIADKQDVIRLKGMTENMLAVLTGMNASEFHLCVEPLTKEPPLIPSGLPSDILLRRPDIAQAERMMAANNEQIGVAVASFFPTVELTGIRGTESPLWHKLFTHPARYWYFQTNIDQILFDGGRLLSNLEAAKAQYEQAEAQYKQTVLTAFQEVENALVSIAQNRERHNALVQTVTANSRSVQLSQNRYFNGLVNYLEVEVQMRTLLQSQLNEQQVLAAQYLSAIQLIRALGGGWETSEERNDDGQQCTCL